MNYLIIEEFPEGEFSITSESPVHTLKEAIAVQKQLQRGHILPVRKDEVSFDEDELIDLLLIIYEKVADHFNYSIDEYFDTKKKECSRSRHIVRGSFIKKFNLGYIEYRNIEGKISQGSVDHATIINSIKNFNRIQTHPEVIDKTVLLIIKPYI